MANSDAEGEAWQAGYLLGKYEKMVIDWPNDPYCWIEFHEGWINGIVQISAWKKRAELYRSQWPIEARTKLRKSYVDLSIEHEKYV